MTPGPQRRRRDFARLVLARSRSDAGVLEQRLNPIEVVARSLLADVARVQALDSALAERFDLHVGVDVIRDRFAVDPDARRIDFDVLVVRDLDEDGHLRARRMEDERGSSSPPGA